MQSNSGLWGRDVGEGWRGVVDLLDGHYSFHDRHSVGNIKTIVSLRKPYLNLAIQFNTPVQTFNPYKRRPHVEIGIAREVTRFQIWFLISFQPLYLLTDSVECPAKFTWDWFVVPYMQSPMLLFQRLETDSYLMGTHSCLSDVIDWRHLLCLRFMILRRGFPLLQISHYLGRNIQKLYAMLMIPRAPVKFVNLWAGWWGERTRQKSKQDADMSNNIYYSLI